ncbi:putative ynbD [Gossypium arboreum]|uniref:Putative ynbD n=1 Tax=Gossypium arboreum TaxID=29729 RepID=A0A0B0PF19_GOSAR|nr:putative ynbD [Gossypium arboreum]
MGLGLSVLIAIKATAWMLLYLFFSRFGFTVLAIPLLIKEFKGHSYLCVPTWDTRAPQPGQIESAVKWACRKRARNQPVYVHCAYGHGRSVAVMCALLVALGVVENWKAAEKYIRERRPCIKMNSLHYKALEEWSSSRLSSPKRNEELDVNSVSQSNSSGNTKASMVENKID